MSPARWSGVTAPSRKPVPKVAAAGTGGLAATALIAIAQQFGVELGPEAAAGLVALVSFAAGYGKEEL